LQCVTMCCCVLQCVAVCCSVLQCVAASCSVMRERHVRAHVYWHDFVCTTWSMTNSYVWHDSFICVTWLIHMCDMTSWVCSARQHAAVHCSTLQHTATSCHMLQHIATRWIILQLKRLARTHVTYSFHAQHDYHTLQHDATYCNTLHHSAIEASCTNATWELANRNDLHCMHSWDEFVWWVRVLQCVAVCCSVSQLCCSVSQCVAVCRSILQDGVIMLCMTWVRDMSSQVLDMSSCECDIHR